MDGGGRFGGTALHKGLMQYIEDPEKYQKGSLRERETGAERRKYPELDPARVGLTEDDIMKMMMAALGSQGYMDYVNWMRAGRDRNQPPPPPTPIMTPTPAYGDPLLGEAGRITGREYPGM